MKEMIIKSYEEECGSELHKLFIPNDTSDEEINKALDMASNYAIASCDILDEEEAEDYGLDEHWKEVYKLWKDCNGIERFFGYLDVVYGWKSEELTYNYEFEW